ncbi:MAG: helix-turn-helix domain-containing protein [Candidatus Woesearchaeota archaeon]
MKKNLLEEIGVMLLRDGFTVKTLTRTCFDIVARKDQRIILIKVLEDANSITEEFATQMKKVSGYISASPIVIAEKAGMMLQDNVVYARFGVFTLNKATFRNAVDNKLPFIMSTKAGLTASVSGDRLRKKIEEAGYSLGLVSRKIGVSKSMISKYESGSDISVNKAKALYGLFGPGVFRAIDIFSELKTAPEKSSSLIVKKYGDLGFEASEARKVPFDIMARKEKEVIFTEIGDKTNPQLESLTKMVDADNLIIFKNKKPKTLPSLTKKEFMDFESANELIKFLKEFEEG